MAVKKNKPTFTFKVKKSKLKNSNQLHEQINLILDRLNEKYGVYDFTIRNYLIGDDFVKDRFTLQIQLN